MTPWPENNVFNLLRRTFIHKHRVILWHVHDLEFVSENLDVCSQYIRLVHLRQFVIIIIRAAVKTIDDPSSFSSSSLKPTHSKSDTHQSINDKVGFTCIFIGIYREYLSKSTRPL